MGTAGHSIPSARVYSEAGIRQGQSWNTPEIRRPVRTAALRIAGILGAFAPLVAVVALATMLLWSVGMAGSP